MTLEQVGAGNWRACLALEVDESQRRIVAPVAYYLALCAYGESPWGPLAVRDGAEVVGFVMWGIDPEDESFWIGGLLIDRRHQRRGCGRSVVAQLLERAAAEGHREAGLSYDQQNTVARSLYASMGFVETGELADDEIVARKQLK
ncbi:diamine N-acetyltransferase [Friedmanniella luteola]|uniref:Diamine N-acetyltransferase n=1 Tax=Friedmanniella luteola TaxID=546871 RepID=A0A1H1WT55_9ACTN|nr:GNAT family N-acetyltransferase [Friedmanniella luteola]SDS99800.1 diamine N-acetyltransferase [Friedmanniella luteola]